MLYFAYGSNLNKAQMRVRCPRARPREPLLLPDAVLRFRGVADVVYLKGAACEGALWEITPECERALDEYEGVNHRDENRGMYRKRYLTIRYRGAVVPVLYYQMNRFGIMPPSQGYYDVIRRGYADFGLDPKRLELALSHSHRRHAPTPQLMRSWKRRGMPEPATLPEPTAGCVDESHPDRFEPDPFKWDPSGRFGRFELRKRATVRSQKLSTRGA